MLLVFAGAWEKHHKETVQEQQTKDTVAEGLENTALAVCVKGWKAGHVKVVFNIAGRRPLASQQAKASTAPCSKA